MALKAFGPCSTCKYYTVQTIQNDEIAYKCSRQGTDNKHFDQDWPWVPHDYGCYLWTPKNPKAMHTTEEEDVEIMT